MPTNFHITYESPSIGRRVDATIAEVKVFFEHYPRYWGAADVRPESDDAKSLFLLAELSGLL